MRNAILIFSLKINHEWYGNTIPPLTVRPSVATAVQMNRDGLLFRAVPGGCEIYTSNDEFNDSVFELHVLNEDPFLIAHTFTGEQTARGIPKVAYSTITSDSDETLVNPADWKAAALPNEPLVTLSVILPSAQLPHMAILRIPALSVHWTYVVDGPWLPDNLEITGSDGSEQFTEIQAPPNSDNGSARKFRSRNPRLSKRTDQMECQLVSSDSTTGPLVSPLPSPTPNVLPRPIPGSDAFEILIYTTVLAKGGS